jgi:retron-type reverse transcriptase
LVRGVHLDRELLRKAITRVELKAQRPRLRLIQKWLNAGVMEEGKWSEAKTGSPQGSVISPLLANIYLHYTFDLWVEVWRKKYAQGDVVVVRYADDLILGFQYQAEADRFLENFRSRLGKFGLELHPDKMAGSSSVDSPNKTGNEEGTYRASPCTSSEHLTQVLPRPQGRRNRI